MDRVAEINNSAIYNEIGDLEMEYFTLLKSYAEENEEVGSWCIHKLLELPTVERNND